MSDAEGVYRAYVDRLAQREVPVRIVRKGGLWHQRFIDLFLRAVTLGGQDRYLSEYVTTLGHTVYVPDDWDEGDPEERYEVLRHELVHVRQFERYGVLGMVLLYGLLPLPAGLAYGRARLEWEAYAETLRVVAERKGLDAARSPALRERIVRRFTGPDYAWMWPFPRAVGRWIDGTLQRLEAEEREGSLRARDSVL